MAVDAIHSSSAGGSESEQEKIESGHVDTIEHVTAINEELTRVNTYDDENRVPLGWRSWLVVLITLWGNVVQVYTVVSVGNIIAFIIRDLGEPGLAGWAIQGPLLIQSVLSPVVGRLSDVIGRKALVVGLPLISFAGACICARATNVNMVIGGSIMSGFTLATLSIVQAIPSEVLPLKYRTVANGSAFLGGAFGGLLGAGALTNQGPTKWRDIYWLQAGFHFSAAFLMLIGYFPRRRSDYQRLSFKEYVWLCDPVGSVLFVAGATLVLMSLDWAPDTYAYSDPHVAASLAVGLALLVGFGLYEWKGRPDGLISHAYFKNGYNFALATFAFGVEGWIFYSAVNSVGPALALNLGWETTSWGVSIRQLAFNCTTIVASVPVV
ncbi:hypothetical protein VTK73DRAFT_6694 [Phialemonium thermophilum]|uniref:Major facilitator superfamily (MFS) profile domain-containing protein n=1 Tax=Phialemonium thermophilum TaxID=223376 RepID=A0ABR3WI91_9PEZI